MSIVTSNYGYFKKFQNDGLNRFRRRNQKNTHIKSYNCGGFALGTFSWYFPWDETILDWAVDKGFITEEIYDEILSNITEDDYYWNEVDFLENYENGCPDDEMDTLCDYMTWRRERVYDLLEDYVDVDIMSDSFLEYYVDYMLKEFPDLRVINNVSEVKDNEYCIAFRVGRNDYHFVRSNRNMNEWIQKPGSRRIFRKTRRVTEELNEDFFNSLFKTGYNSKVVLFAKTI